MAAPTEPQCSTPKPRRKSFRSWLTDQLDRDDPVGDLARDAIFDSRWIGKSRLSLRCRMGGGLTTCSGAYDALAEAGREYAAWLASVSEERP
jgi:hypothetical protein